MNHVLNSDHRKYNIQWGAHYFAATLSQSEKLSERKRKFPPTPSERETSFGVANASIDLTDSLNAIIVLKSSQW